MWKPTLPPEQLKQAIKDQTRHHGPLSFVDLAHTLPQLRGTRDFAVNGSFILWRGVSEGGAAALTDLHADGAIFFWLCSPAIYTRTGDAPFLKLMCRSPQPGEPSWLPTLIHDRAQSPAESRDAVRDYVAAMMREPVVVH